jgi:hypothetical protein
MTCNIMLNPTTILCVTRQICLNKLVRNMSDPTTEHGFHSYLFTPIPNRLSEINQLFEQKVNALQAVKDSMMKEIKVAEDSMLEEIGVKVLTLSPKDAFELRLRCLAVINPKFDTDKEEEEVAWDIYEYSLHHQMFYKNKKSSYWSFLREDDRYYVEFEEFDKEDSRQKLELSIKQLQQVPEFNQIFQNGAEKIKTASEFFLVTLEQKLSRCLQKIPLKLESGHFNSCIHVLALKANLKESL